MLRHGQRHQEEGGRVHPQTEDRFSSLISDTTGSTKTPPTTSAPFAAVQSDLQVNIPCTGTGRGTAPRKTSRGDSPPKDRRGRPGPAWDVCNLHLTMQYVDAREAAPPPVAGLDLMKAWLSPWLSRLFVPWNTTRMTGVFQDSSAGKIPELH